MVAALKYATWILKEFFEVCSHKLVLECDKNTRIFIFYQTFISILVLGLSQKIVSKVGKKGAIYIPKHVCEQLGIGEGDKAVMKIEGKRLVLEFIPDPLSLAMKVKKWTKTTVEEFEKESEEMQDALFNH